MTIGKVSSYAAYINQVRTLQTAQTQINELSDQMSSGKKSTDLSFYGPDAQRLLDLKAEYARRQGFQTAIDNVTPRVKAYDKILTRLNDIVTDLGSTTRLPPGPGTPLVDRLTNPSNGNLKISVDQVVSRFTTNATYTVTSVPSTTGPSGSFDVTVTDGLGGRVTQTVNLKKIPPQNDGDRFVISGGPGDGTVLKLNFDQLKGPGTSSFTVTYPDVVPVRERVIGVMNEVQSLLNERIGDRYLFSGSRYDVKPVADLVSAKQVTKLTLTGTVGRPGETYEVYVNGQRFTYLTTGNETSLEDVWKSTGAPPSEGLFTQIHRIINQDIANGDTPRLPLTASVTGNVMTLIGTGLGAKFEVKSTLYTAGGTENTVTGAAVPVDPNRSLYTMQDSTTALPQIDEVNLNGANVDVGDVFTLKVGERRTVQVTDDGDPTTPEVSYETIDGPTEYSYVMNEADIAAARADPLGAMNFVATKLAALVNADPNRAADANVVAPGAPPFDTAQVQLTGPVDKRFATTMEITNANSDNRIINNTLPPLSEPVTFETQVREPDLPYYDTQYHAAREAPRAYDQARLFADEGLPVDYGVTSTDPSVQKLVAGLRRARAAVENPANYEKLMVEARELLVQAQTELRQVQARIVTANSVLQTASERHKDNMNAATEQIAGIEGIDQNEVAAKLRQLLTTQEANYTVAGRIAQLSLVNFLA